MGSWAVLYAREINDGLRTRQGFIDVRVSPAHTGDYPTVQDGIGTPEFKPGDRILSVEGEDLRGASALRFYDLSTRAARERGAAVIRGERGGTTFDVPVPLAPREGWWLPLVTQAV